VAAAMAVIASDYLVLRGPLLLFKTTLLFQQLADQIGISFLEASAKNAINVEEVFMTMTAEIKSRKEVSTMVNPKQTVKINKSTPVGSKPDKGGGCTCLH
jgi:glycine cleavage system pyridoxal-binding protein P